MNISYKMLIKETWNGNKSNVSLTSIYNVIFCSLHFPATDGLKKSYQLLIGQNEIHTVIPDIHVLQVVVERVLHVQRSYSQLLRGKQIFSYCSPFFLIILASCMSYGTSPSYQHWQKVSWNGSSWADLHVFIKPGVILSDPCTLPFVKWSMVKLSSPMDGTESS